MRGEKYLVGIDDLNKSSRGIEKLKKCKQTKKEKRELKVK